MDPRSGKQRSVDIFVVHSEIGGKSSHTEHPMSEADGLCWNLGLESSRLPYIDPSQGNDEKDSHSIGRMHTALKEKLCELGVALPHITIIGELRAGRFWAAGAAPNKGARIKCSKLALGAVTCYDRTCPVAQGSSKALRGLVATTELD